MKHKQTEHFFTRATVDTSTIVDTENERSFWAIAATESLVPRSGWEENFNEVLSCVKENMRTSRIEAGAVPLLNNHQRYDGVDGQLGTITDYEIRNNEVHVKVLFSTQERFNGIWKDIKAKIIRSISSGYAVYKYVREVVENSNPTYRAIDWEPMEVSLAPVPADFKSAVREDAPGHEIIIENFSPIQNRNTDMKENKTEVVETSQGATATQAEQRSAGEQKPTTAPVDVNQVRNEGMIAERTRITDIQTAVRNSGLDAEVANDLISRGVSIADARTEIINKLAEKNNTQVRTVSTATITVDETEKTREAIGDALLHRARPGSVKLEGKAQDYKYMSMLDIARSCLSDNGEKPARYSASEVIKRAIATTDYPNLLNNAVERSIRREYASIPATWKEIASQKTAKDFREVTGIALDGKVTFEEIAEGGEYKHDLMLVEDNAKLKLKTYGRMIKITRQAIINDDLSVFDRLPKLLAQGANDFQADKVWALLTGNAKTPDGKTLFHADHKNLITPPGVMSEQALGLARNAMYRQKTPGGQIMGISAAWLVVPIEQVMLAEKLMTSVLAGITGDVNTLAGKFKIVTDPHLTDPNAWYLIADPKRNEGLVYAYLEGEEGLFTDKEVNFNDDTVTTKARLDFDCAVWDYRGFAKNAGA